MTRRELRENIFKIVFRAEFHGKDEMTEQRREYMKDKVESDDISDKDNEYIREKAKNVISHIEEIDKMLEEASDGWSVKRIGKTELAILRLAVYEIKFDDDIPFKVAVNEAVEISKNYCEPEASAFINGVLAKFSE
ncbi:MULTISPECIES: transcription antitermination factor NusB [Eubacterium]|jgi:N utilization substance protein B|uniref:Transcription antitermination protein NusB n=1 Tax=Eubacterium ruminantium TaxID=42322 RepID=A0A1T4MIM5_9FIRM|nr:MULTISPECIES: transcription antitermination factor NusB [Eubacterium]MCR5367680.1 transcription antitermination factor NusB [Eubacterium sp.]SCW48288.1 NusB antitermination factor [Eubacterium ruminantium]SDM57131.1 NusB antitermination factor [Eubacterium ruminantium]SJZ66705.1 NusB antitermination factor [Eubacterium ruminantium]